MKKLKPQIPDETTTQSANLKTQIQNIFIDCLLNDSSFDIFYNKTINTIVSLLPDENDIERCANLYAEQRHEKHHNSYYRDDFSGYKRGSTELKTSIMLKLLDK